MMISIHRLIAATAGVVVLGLISTGVLADERPYTEGNVVNVAGIRTEYGHFDDYLKFLSTTWKQEMEASKKAGLIVSYEVLQVEPRGPDDPDVYLVITYKNWAALDGLTAKSDAIASQVYGSVVKSNEGAAERGKIRRTVGSQTMQVLNLK
ncbi:MAG: hypothetical protein ACREU6_07315 [Steroidobacteraceae bacterium]